ncbi:hypothetical protein FO519_002958 [Halicephalobus sp. NKZ332]|nr:hypothetical protein FO519_002958 [Halicephalobus sp. NKZ332]
MYPKAEITYSDRDSLLLLREDRCSGILKKIFKLFLTLLTGVLLSSILSEGIYYSIYRFSGLTRGMDLLDDSCLIQLPFYMFKKSYDSNFLYQVAESQSSLDMKSGLERISEEYSVKAEALNQELTAQFKRRQEILTYDPMIAVLVTNVIIFISFITVTCLHPEKPQTMYGNRLRGYRRLMWDSNLQLDFEKLSLVSRALWLFIIFVTPTLLFLCVSTPSRIFLNLDVANETLYSPPFLPPQNFKTLILAIRNQKRDLCVLHQSFREPAFSPIRKEIEQLQILNENILDDLEKNYYHQVELRGTELKSKSISNPVVVFYLGHIPYLAIVIASSCFHLYSNYKNTEMRPLSRVLWFILTPLLISVTYFVTRLAFEKIVDIGYKC